MSRRCDPGGIPVMGEEVLRALGPGLVQDRRPAHKCSVFYIKKNPRPSQAGG